MYELNAQVSDPNTGLAKASADITEINDVSATSDSAVARKMYELNAQVSDPNTGLAKVAGDISEINDISLTSDSAAARAIKGLSTATYDENGAPAYQAAITGYDEALTGPNGAIAQQISQLDLGLGETAIDAKITTSNRAFIGYCSVGAAGEHNDADACTAAGGEWLTAKPFVDSFNNIKVTNEAGESISVSNYMSALEDETGELKARIFLGIDANGRLSGMFVNGSEEETDISFAADKISFVNPVTGYNDLSYNALTQQLAFAGDFSAAQASFSRNSNTMHLNKNGFLLWYGSNTDAANPQATNAIWFLDDQGNYKRDFSRTRASTSTFSTSVDLTPSPHFVVAGEVELDLAFDLDMFTSTVLNSSNDLKGRIDIEFRFYVNATLIYSREKSYQYRGDTFGGGNGEGFPEPEESTTSLSVSGFISYTHNTNDFFTDKGYRAEISISDTGSLIDNATAKELTAKFTTLGIA